MPAYLLPTLSTTVHCRQLSILSTGTVTFPVTVRARQGWGRQAWRASAVDACRKISLIPASWFASVISAPYLTLLQLSHGAHHPISLQESSSKTKASVRRAISVQPTGVRRRSMPLRDEQHEREEKEPKARHPDRTTPQGTNCCRTTSLINQNHQALCIDSMPKK